MGVAPNIGGPGGVSVSTGGSGVLVGVGSGVSVVGIGVKVSTGVAVGASVAVGTGVRVGGTSVLVGMGVGLGRRVLVGSLDVGNLKAVGRGATVVGKDVTVCVGRRVGVDVGISSANACIVSAPAVFRLETAAFTMSAGCKARAVVDCRRSCIAIPETEHSRLIPIAAATKTARRPRYSLIFTLVALHSIDKSSHCFWKREAGRYSRFVIFSRCSSI